MTDVPDPQPPAPEASVDVDELEKTISRVLSYVITEDGSSQQARDALKALAARLRQAERKAEYAWKFVGRCEVAEGKLREAEARVRELGEALRERGRRIPGLIHACPTAVLTSPTFRESLDPMALGTCRYCGERLPASPHKEPVSSDAS